MNPLHGNDWPDAPGAGPLGDGRFATEAVHPRTVDEVREAVTRQAEAGRAVYPQGGRTALDYGRPPGRPGAAVDVSGLNRVIDYPHADMTITVQAGMTVAALRSVLAEHRQRFLIDVPQADRATIGGVYATNASGPRRFGLGPPRDQIIGVSFVTSDGNEVKGGGRVVKNVAGYDFPKLMTGSLGTLGVITQATLKVRPRPGASALVWLAVDGPGALEAYRPAIDASALRPVAVEFLNPSAATILGRSVGLVGGVWTLVLGFEDAATSVAWQVDHLRSMAQGPVEVLRDDEAQPLWTAMTDFQAAPGPLVCSASMRPSFVAEFMAEFASDRWALQAHAGSGVVRMRAIQELSEDQAAADVAASRARIASAGGALVVVRCPTAWKPRLKVWGDPRPDWALGRAVKTALDPIGLMNPGRFVGEV